MIDRLNIIGKKYTKDIETNLNESGYTNIIIKRKPFRGASAQDFDLKRIKIIKDKDDIIKSYTIG